MRELFQLIMGLCVGYAAISLAESFLHKNVQHASTKTLAFWRRHPRLFKPFLRAYYAHHVIHHIKTFRQNHVTQFESSGEKAAVDALLDNTHGDGIKRERYGVTLVGLGVLRFIAPVSFLIPLLYLVGGPFVLAGALVPIVVYPMMSKFIHPCLHMRHDEALRAASGFKRWLLQTHYMKFIARHHYLHHRHMKYNFNLLWGGDFLLGVHRRPSSKDLVKMRALGLPTD